jgi:alkaline phosphatase
MSAGEKTYRGAIGVDADGFPLEHAIERAEELGMATGVITSVEWSHATPAGFVAHNVSRNNYAAIAQEMVYDSTVNVIMGCGHPWYDKDGEKICDPADLNYPDDCKTFKYVGGVDTWDDLVTGIAGGWTLIQTREAFQALITGDTPDRVIGVAQVHKTLQEERSGDGKANPYEVPLIATVPTLEEMTKAALNVLDNDPDGLFLMAEGGAVDWAGHGNESGRVIEEEIDFNRSVEAVVEWVEKNSNWGETLVIVTGDHETGYLTGPGSNPNWIPLENNGAGNLPGMEWHSGSHTNQLIPFYAKGRGAQLFRKDGVMMSDPVRGNYIDNTKIAEVIFRLLD